MRIEESERLTLELGSWVCLTSISAGRGSTRVSRSVDDEEAAAAADVRIRGDAGWRREN